MHWLDWAGITLFFLLLVVIGLWSYRKVRGSSDFFVAGGKVPWWLSGISHHATGYSATVFVAYAAIAYTEGFTIYVWWSLTIAMGLIVGAFLIAPRWVRLRVHIGIETPTTYLKQRYNLPTQQFVAWSGVVLKVFELGAKWAAIGVLLNVFTGMPTYIGILLSGVISLIYIVIGGLWADLWTDLAQLIVQVIAVLIMFFGIMNHLGGFSSITNIWDQLPAENSQFFNSPYTFWYALAFLFVNFLSYNGGTWALAARYMATPSERAARKSALLSAALMLVLPLFIFFPMWAAPIIFPDIGNPDQSYALMALEFLPAGMLGLALAGLFAATMSSTSSDINTISAVITRDIMPVVVPRFRGLGQRAGLRLGRVVTFLFASATIIIGIQADRFGGVIGLTVEWFGALVGPVAIPLLLGLIPTFRHSGPIAAIGAVISGVAGFTVTKFLSVPLSVEVGTPVLVAAIVYVLLGTVDRNKPVPEGTTEIITATTTSTDQDGKGQGDPEAQSTNG